MRGRPQRTDRPKGLRALFEAVPVSDVARIVNRAQSTVSAWIQVPAEHVLRLEKHTGVSRHKLRPDLYPQEATR